nr:MAG TPA: hypothetical protein [Caudoviricetes sp.]
MDRSCSASMLVMLIAIKISSIKVVITLCYSVENWYIIGTWQVNG